MCEKIDRRKQTISIEMIPQNQNIEKYICSDLGTNKELWLFIAFTQGDYRLFSPFFLLVNFTILFLSKEVICLYMKLSNKQRTKYKWITGKCFFKLKKNKHANK